MSKPGVIRVATCQFAVTGRIKRNALQIRRQMVQAKAQRADLVHFSETALTGYAGTNFESWEGFDWATLRSETERIMELARAKKLWVVLGSTHRLTGKHLPHNSLYIISPAGRIVDRYDKCFCTNGDLRFYSPGTHLPVFKVNGVTCGALICYDLRFPELYRKYKRLGVECLFQSFHNADSAGGPNVWTRIMRQTMQCRAATNYFWVSANNSSAYYQSWPSVFIKPSGETAGQLKFHRAGVMVNTVDTSAELYDASGAFRDRAMRGVLHTGRPVKDARSHARTSL